MKPDKLKQLFFDIAPDYSAKYDPWGTAIAAAFDVAAEAYRRGLPDRLDYRPGAGGPDISEENAAYLAGLPDDDIDRLAVFIAGLLRRLEAAGRSY